MTAYKIPVSLTFYTTSKGHFGNRDCYRSTIERLVEDGILYSFSERVAHIKDSGEGTEDIKRFLVDHGFEIKIRKGEWDNHNHVSKNSDFPIAGYYGDMFNLMSEQSVQNNEFIFFLEDDNIINNKKELTYFLKEGVNLLRKNKDILCIRINRTDIEGWDDISKATKITKDIYVQDEDYTKYGPTLTFQPTIMRTRDWFAAVRFINKNWDQFKDSHCEIVSGHVMRYLFSDASKPFAFFDPELISCEHIGTREFAKNHG
jgi:hypothetical protein